MSMCVHTQHMRDPAQPTAARLVAELFPHARAAWLGGSVARGAATPTSDLDIVVLTADDPVHRRSLLYSGWPVELFVHTDASMRKYFASDIARRQPSLPRMVGEALLLRDQDGDGHRWGQTARQVLSDGPAPLTQAELDDARYTITDLIDDLAGNPPPTETAAIAALLWQHVLTPLSPGRGSGAAPGKALSAPFPQTAPSAASPRFDPRSVAPPASWSTWPTRSSPTMVDGTGTATALTIPRIRHPTADHGDREQPQGGKGSRVLGRATR